MSINFSSQAVISQPDSWEWSSYLQTARCETLELMHKDPQNCTLTASRYKKLELVHKDPKNRTLTARCKQLELVHKGPWELNTDVPT